MNGTSTVDENFRRRRRLHLPPMKITVDPGVQMLTWLRKTPFSELPNHIQQHLKQMGGESEEMEYMFYTFGGNPMGREKCRVCRKGERIAALDLCIQCFYSISQDMESKGIIESALTGQLDTVPRLYKLLNRLGVIRIRVQFGTTYFVVQGREREFCETLSDFLGLRGTQRLTIESMASRSAPSTFDNPGP